jgi:toxin ParE1/3/4
VRTVKKYPGAERDLLEIAYYISEDSVPNAERFIDSIEAECQKLADSPILLGRPCMELHPELRRHNFKRYAILYLPATDGIELVGVFHGSRDFEAIFEWLGQRLSSSPLPEDPGVR